MIPTRLAEWTRIRTLKAQLWHFSCKGLKPQQSNREHPHKIPGCRRSYPSSGNDLERAVNALSSVLELTHLLARCPWRHRRPVARGEQVPRSRKTTRRLFPRVRWGKPRRTELNTSVINGNPPRRATSRKSVVGSHRKPGSTQGFYLHKGAQLTRKTSPQIFRIYSFSSHTKICSEIFCSI